MNRLLNNWRMLSLATFVFCIITYATVFLPQDTFLEMIREDGLFEWSGAICFLISSILFFIIFFRKGKFAKEEDALYFNSKSKKVWFFLLGLLFFVLFAEEISWGQRIIGFSTPDAIKQDNMQEEFNLHNYRSLHLFDENNERKSGLALHLTAKRIFIYVFVLFMLVLPLAVKWIPFIRDLVKKLYIPVPVVELGILFTANVVLYLLYKPFGAHNPEVGNGIAEVQEFNFAFILLYLPFVWYGRSARDYVTVEQTDQQSAI